jgi:mRNA interferase RelE/StbE
MGSFRISWKSSVLRELKSLPRDVVSRVVRAVEMLAGDPHPPGAKKLTGSQHTYRIRQGDYRVVYDVLADQVLIEVIRVAHRRDVYR